MYVDYKQEQLWHFAGFLLGMLQLLILVIAIGCSDIIGICLLASIQAVVNMITVVIASRCLLSVSIFFLFFSYVLHMGQYTLHILDTKVVPSVDLFKKIPEDLLIHSGRYVIIAQTFVCIGIVVYHYFLYFIRVRKQTRWYHSDTINFTIFKYIAAILFVTGIVPSIIIHLNKIKLMLEGGYYNTFSYAAETGGIKFFVSNIWQMGVLLWLIVYKCHPWKCRILYAGSVGYLMLTMLSGSRMTALTYIMMFTLFYLKVIEPLDLRKAILFTGIGFLSAGYIVQIGLTRSGGNGEINGLTDVCAKVLAEFGGTLYSVALTIEHFPKDASFAYGRTYLLSPIYALPNLGQWPDEILSYTRFVDYIKDFTTSGLGGTYIGEVYFNFGYWGIFFFFFIGIVLAWYDKKINSAIVRKDWFCLLICMGVLPYIFIWTRSYFKDMIRPLIWQSILLIALYRLFIKNKHFD